MRKMIRTNSGAEITLSDRPYYTDSADAMVEIYNALQWSPTGNVAVKLSTGEPPASNYLRPELVADLVRLVDGTIVECNTAYGGSRASTALHYQVAEDHESLVDRIESRNVIHTLENAEAIGLGSRAYHLVNLDG